MLMRLWCIFMNKIREVRISKGMKFDDLAYLSGVSHTYLSRLERNLIPDSKVSTYQRIARVLEIDWKELVE